MPRLPKTLAAGAASLAVLCSAAGSAFAMPSAGGTRSTGHETRLQVAHYGNQAVAAERQQPERFVRIAAFSWSKAADLMQASLTIESALPFALKEIEVACAQFARSGVEIDSSRRRIAELLPAHGQLQVSALIIGQIHPQARSSGCRIVRVIPAARRRSALSHAWPVRCRDRRASLQIRR